MILKLINISSSKYQYYFARLAKLLNLKHITSRYGIKLVSNWDDTTFRFSAFGSYGVFLSNLLSTKSNKFHFIDIGANQGLYSLIAGSNPNCVSVFCFEPVKATYDLLRKNILLNGLDHKIVSKNFAISDSNESIEIFIPQNHSGAASLRADKLAMDGHTEVINCLSSSELQRVLPDDLPIFVKVDVEGHEVSVLSELSKTKQMRLVDSVFYEVDQDWVDPTEIEKTLRAAGFSVFKKIGDDVSHYDVLATRE